MWVDERLKLARQPLLFFNTLVTWTQRHKALVFQVDIIDFLHPLYFHGIDICMATPLQILLLAVRAGESVALE